MINTYRTSGVAVLLTFQYFCASFSSNDITLFQHLGTLARCCDAGVRLVCSLRSSLPNLVESYHRKAPCPQFTACTTFPFQGRSGWFLHVSLIRELMSLHLLVAWIIWWFLFVRARAHSDLGTARHLRLDDQSVFKVLLCGFFPKLCHFAPSPQGPKDKMAKLRSWNLLVFQSRSCFIG